MVNSIIYNYNRVEEPQPLVKNIKEHIHYVEDVEKILITNKKKDVHHVVFQMLKLEDVYFKNKFKDDGWGEKVR